MEFKVCHRCGGDLRSEEDMTSRLEELVCLQCGNRQGTLALAGRITRGMDEPLQLTARTRSKYAA